MNSPRLPADAAVTTDDARRLAAAVHKPDAALAELAHVLEGAARRKAAIQSTRRREAASPRLSVKAVKHQTTHL